MARRSLAQETVVCVRCDKVLRPRAQVVLLQYGADILVAHPYPKCYSLVDDIVIRQGMITADGASVGPVVPD